VALNRLGERQTVRRPQRSRPVAIGEWSSDARTTLTRVCREIDAHSGGAELLATTYPVSDK